MLTFEPCATTAKRESLDTASEVSSDGSAISLQKHEWPPATT